MTGETGGRWRQCAAGSSLLYRAAEASATQQPELLLLAATRFRQAGALSLAAECEEAADDFTVADEDICRLIDTAASECGKLEALTLGSMNAC
jgi:hypothetical protein